MATNDEIRAKDVVPELTDFRDGTDGLYGDGSQSSFFMKAMNLAKSILGRIHLLPNTATEADLVSGNYIPLDGNVPKKLPAECVAKRSVQDNVVQSMAPVFSSTDSYMAGQSVTQQGKLYIFKVDHPAGAWNVSHVDATDAQTQYTPYSNFSTLTKDIGEQGTYGWNDESTFTHSMYHSTVIFQRSKTQKKPTIVTLIRYYASSTHTAEIYKVKVTGSTATETLLFSAGKGETGWEDYHVNIPLGADEYIGVKGDIWYEPDIPNEQYADITGGNVSAFYSGVFGLYYEGIVEGELLGEIDDIKNSIETIYKVNGIITNSGGNISKSTAYTTQTAVFWPKSSVPKIKYVTGIKLPSLEYGCSIYKVTENGSTATSVKLADIPAQTEHYNLFVELADNEYIGISGFFKYSNSAGTGYDYYYADSNNVIHQTAGGTIALEIEGIAKGKDPYNVVVASDGSGDYTTIHDALVGTYGIDTASKPVTIKVKAGIYDEPSMDGGFYPYCNNRYLAIIGENKENTIVRNTNGYYYPSVQDNSCIKVAGNVYIANLTLISLATNYQDPPDTEYTNQKNAYCVHIDSEASSGDITEVNNCIMYNDHNCCVGIGIKTNHTVKIRNCEMRSHFVNPNITYGGAVIYAHDYSNDTAGQMREFLDIEGCIIRSENSGLGIKVLNVYGKDIVCSFVGNALSYLDAGSGCSLGATTYKDKVCSGNNVPIMNY